MEKIRRDYPDIAPAGPTFTRGIRCGDMLFVSGCTARGTPAQEGPLMDQLRVTLERVTGVVGVEGGGPGDIVKITTFVTSIADWQGARGRATSPLRRIFQGRVSYQLSGGNSSVGPARPGG